MSQASRRCLSVLVFLAACGDSAPTSPTPDVGERPADAATVDLGGVTARAAAAICRGLTRCCDDSMVDYFASYRADERLAAFKTRLPPDVILDEPGCRVVVAEMLDVVYLGEWFRAVAANEVTFDAPAFDACLAALDAAACGPSMRDTLWDSTCLGLAPPSGGTEQRAFVHRTRHVGEACAPIRDGIGGAFYGSCDPQQGFCCYTDATHPGCQFPFAGDGTTRPGTCQAVAAIDAPCSAALPLKLCASGNDCDPDRGTCVAPMTAALAVGASCIDASYNLLGTCTNSWCDVLGTKRCEMLRPDGVACTGGDECSSGLCQTTCRPNTICE